MKCLDCGLEMEHGTIDSFGQGGSAMYQFTADTEKEKKGIKGFFTKNIVSVLPGQYECSGWHCPKCKKVLMWLSSDE